MNVCKTIELELKSGQVLTLDLSDVLLERIRSTFELESSDQITERHIKYYLISSMKNAVKE